MIIRSDLQLVLLLSVPSCIAAYRKSPPAHTHTYNCLGLFNWFSMKLQFSALGIAVLQPSSFWPCADGSETFLQTWILWSSYWESKAPMTD